MGFEVIPVMDLENGVVVHAKYGIREKYTPVKSKISPTAKPLDIALSFVRKFGFNKIYIADLNAISQCGNNFHVVREIITRLNVKVMLDAGICDVQSLKDALDLGIWKAIVATETLPSIEFIEQAIEVAGAENIIFSLDMFEGKLLTKCPQLKNLSPIKVAELLSNFNTYGIIVLELSRVGSKRGVDVALVRKIVEVFEGRVFVGGGVRDINDLKLLKSIGASGALVATALHDGTLKPSELKQL